MKINIKSLIALAIIGAVSLLSTAHADNDISVVGADGYDLVAYQTEGKAMKGSGYHVTEHKGTTYAFASKKNLKAFEKEPTKYLPQFGGYCAYGVSVGKKFVANPEFWRVEGGRLYFNLDQDIQKTWQKDLADNIRKGRENWVDIRHKSPSEL